jgi:signal transduction histidine kinase
MEEGGGRQALSSWLPLPLAVASYVVSTALCLCDWPPWLVPGRNLTAGSISAASLRLGVPSSVHLFPLGLHLSTLVHAIIARTTHLTGTGAEHASLLIYVSFVSTATHTLLAFSDVPARQTVYGSVFIPLRLVTWTHSTPAMLMLLVHIAGKGRAAGWKVAGQQVGSLLCALYAVTTTSLVAANTAMFFSCLLFVPVIVSIHQRFRAAQGPVEGAGTMRGRAVLLCHVLTLCLWSAYPMVMLASITQLIGVYTSELCWGSLDAITKTVYAITLLQASLVTSDEAALAAVSAVTDAKARQLAALCHEIRNPLNGIVCNLCELDDLTQGCSTPSDAATQGMVTQTLTCAAHQRRTLDDFLEQSNADQKALRLSPSPVELHALFTNVASQVLRAARDKGLCLHMRFVPPQLGSTAWVMDAGRVSQILANFAWNSCKFTSEGRITLLCRLDEDTAAEKTQESSKQQQQQRQRLVFEVVDTGIGLSTELQQRLFQPFEQAHTSRIDKFGGSGLGLNICKVLAGLMGGSVGATSGGLGKGSTFWLRLEADMAPPDEYGVPRQPWTEGDKPCGQCGMRGVVSAGALRRSSSWGYVSFNPEPLGAGTSGSRRSFSRRSSFDTLLSLSHVDSYTMSPGRLSDGGGSTSAKLDAALRELADTVDTARQDVLGPDAAPAWSGAMEAAGGGATRTDAFNLLSSAADITGAPASPPRQQLGAVLLIDDEPVNTILLRRRLSREAPACQVNIAEDGTDLVRLCCDEGRRYDVILMDQYMRTMNGDVAVSLLRAHEARHGLPRALVLCYSGNSSDADFARFADAGFDGILCKPINPLTFTQDLAGVAAMKAVALGAGTLGSITLFEPLGFSVGGPHADTSRGERREAGGSQ